MRGTTAEGCWRETSTRLSRNLTQHLPAQQAISQCGNEGQQGRKRERHRGWAIENEEGNDTIKGEESHLYHGGVAIDQEATGRPPPAATTDTLEHSCWKT